MIEHVRPIPVEGLPAIGYHYHESQQQEDNQNEGHNNASGMLYMAVVHSGVTVALTLAPLVATEIVQGDELDILQPYHPSRFTSNSWAQEVKAD
jgi:hypothetical protein